MDEPKNRNPFIVPEERPMPRRGCPICKGMNFGGNMVYGVVTFTCRDCGNQWQGGVGQVAQDPREPMPPEDPRSIPNIDFEKSKTSPTPVEVQRRRPDLNQSFRKGAPIPSPGDEDA